MIKIMRFRRFAMLMCCFFATLSQISQPARAQVHAEAAASGPNAQGPRVELLTERAHVSLRGLSVVNDKVIWVSGSGGTVGRSIDGGATWSWITVPNYEKRDFRDIEAFDENTAIIMAISEPAQILKTNDGGQTWLMVYQNEYSGMFLDAMDFADANNGIVVGDPIHGHFFQAQTFDG